MSASATQSHLTPFQESQLISTLLKSPLLRDVSLTVLRDLLRVAAHHRCRPGEVLHRMDEGCLDKGLLVLSGELEVKAAEGYTVGAASRGGQGGASQRLTLCRGDSFGEPCLLSGEQWEGEITALRASTILVLGQAEFQLLLDHSPSLRRAVGQRPEALVLAVSAPARYASLPVSALTELLALAVDACFPETVLVLRLSGRGDDPLPVPEPERMGGADRAWLVELSLGSLGRLEEALSVYLPRFDYILLDASPCPRPLREAVEAAHHRLCVTFDPQEAEAILPAAAHGEKEVMHTLLLGEGGVVHPDADQDEAAWDVAGFTVFEGRTGAKSRAMASHALGRAGAVEPGGQRGSSAGEPLKESCRLLLPVAALQRRWATDPDRDRCRLSLYQEHREELDRWARFITQRTIGVALGGGGAWGYIHVALLQLLAEAGVPVDMISGTSFGSVVGAYYCALGPAGLARLVSRGGRLQAVSLVSLFTTRGLEWVVNRDLNGARLETTRLPFYPVTTNLTTTQGVALSRGPVALGVRASSSAPFLFAPTLILGMTPAAGRFVDGVVVNNVPVNALLKKGADLVVGSNVYPAPSGRPITPAGAVARLSDLVGLGRFADASTSLNLALHAVGDWQAAMANVTYDASEAILGISSSLGAARFALAETILERAREDAHLHDVVADVASRWRRLRDQRPS